MPAERPTRPNAPPDALREGPPPARHRAGTPAHAPDSTPNPNLNPFSETLTGVLERVTYHNEENGYTVARLSAEPAV